ncbi:MAG TPA: hypothetical protein PKC21_09525 [Oligoflexia bacterium]|nr:hypothetical protein [Oligoflexia bacterium]HMR25577.1 hypothetical protein [Oligoflexia bacterium]
MRVNYLLLLGFVLVSALAQENLNIKLPQIKIVVNDTEAENGVQTCSKRYSEASCKRSFVGSVCSNDGANGVCSVQAYKNEHAICMCGEASMIEEVIEEAPRAYQCDNHNVFGNYPEGGGCNTFGCYEPGGGCNTFGCYEAGGGCNTFGCYAQGGMCSATQCTKKRESKKLVCE